MEKYKENRKIFKNKILESAVMICILHCNEDNKDYIVLEKRAEGIRQGGEISFPGGKREKKDKNFLDTALRETSEELGIDINKIENPVFYGTFFFTMGVLLETFIGYLKVEKISDIRYNKDEVEKLLVVPIDFFVNNEPIIEGIRVYNKPLFDVEKYNFTKRYKQDWHFPDRKIYIYLYENEAIWGMTAEIIFDFIESLKKEGKAGNYEYK